MNTKLISDILIDDSRAKSFKENAPGHINFYHQDKNEKWEKHSMTGWYFVKIVIQTRHLPKELNSRGSTVLNSFNCITTFQPRPQHMSFLPRQNPKNRNWTKCYACDALIRLRYNKIIQWSFMSEQMVSTKLGYYKKHCDCECLKITLNFYQSLQMECICFQLTYKK